MIWREKRILLIVLALILVANTVFFFTYRVQYQNRLDTLDERLAQVQGELDQARDSRIRGEQTLLSYRKVENDVLDVFNERWATQPERFTKLFSEVSRLATASSLVPTTYIFAKGDAKRVSSGSRRETLGATEVSISFGVKGTYEQVRRMINLLELSQQFVIIEGISLSAAENQTLSFDLKLKTIFRDEEAKGVATNRL
jgi:type II secretory pathway pseudopilin PulG